MIHECSHYTRKPKNNKNKFSIFANGRRVGHVVDGEFHKVISGSKHFLRKPKLAIANDIAVLEDAKAAGAVWAVVRDRETGIVYKARVDHILKHGFEFDRGWGRQVALPIENGWIRSGRGIQLELF